MGWATLRLRLKSWHSEKISYHMNSSTTLFVGTGTEAKRLIGVNGVCNRRRLREEKSFFSRQGTCVPQETSATHRLKCSRNCKDAPHSGSAGSRGVRSGFVFDIFCCKLSGVRSKWENHLLAIGMSYSVTMTQLLMLWKDMLTHLFICHFVCMIATRKSQQRAAMRHLP